MRVTQLAKSCCAFISYIFQLICIIMLLGNLPRLLAPKNNKLFRWHVGKLPTSCNAGVPKTVYWYEVACMYQQD